MTLIIAGEFSGTIKAAANSIVRLEAKFEGKIDSKALIYIGSGTYGKVEIIAQKVAIENSNELSQKMGGLSTNITLLEKEI